MMKKLLFSLISLIALSVLAQEHVGFVPYNTTNKHTIGGIVYTNGTFTGNGSGLTNLNASKLASGTVPEARLPLLFGGITNAQSVSSGTNILVQDSQTIIQNGSANTLVVTNGRVGIKRTSPDYDFDIQYGSSSAIGAQVRNTSSGGSLLALRCSTGDPIINFMTLSNIWTIGQDTSDSGVLKIAKSIALGSAATDFITVGNDASMTVLRTVTASNFVATVGGLTLPVLSAAPLVAGNNGVLWLSNSAAPTLWITTTNGTFAH